MRNLETRIVFRQRRVQRMRDDAAFWRRFGREDLARRSEQVLARELSSLARLESKRDAGACQNDRHRCDTESAEPNENENGYGAPTSLDFRRVSTASRRS